MKNRQIIIRADGNARIGAGHLMRCLTIADAFGDKECVSFICADEDSAALARDKGYCARVLGTEYSDMEAELPVWEWWFADDAIVSKPVLAAVSDSAIAEASEAALGGMTEAVLAEASEPALDKAADAVPADAPKDRRVILVDSYYVTNQYITSLRRFGRVILLDDMATTPWNADVVINYNAFADIKMYEALNSPYDTCYYTGGKYIPIRDEFSGRDYHVRENVKNILITTGGGDCDNIAGQILEYIWSEKCHYHLVAGRYNPHYDVLVEFTKERPNIQIYNNVKDMAQLMEQCDLAVTAGGTTIYELSAIGVPFICFSYAENQEKLTEYIGKRKIAGYGGAFHKEPELTLSSIREQIIELTEDIHLRCKYSNAEHELADGRGAARIAEILRRSTC